MVVRLDGLDLRRSLRSALGNAASSAVEDAAVRQERTIDAVLRRLYASDQEQRREMVLLADEVGLGKTFVALGVAWSVLHQRSSAGLPSGPVLVVTPHAYSLFKKWQREAERFLHLVAPPGKGFYVEAVSTPHELAHALKRRRPTLVIARMPAFSGRLHQVDTARMAAIHTLLRLDGFHLSMDNRLAIVSGLFRDPATRETLDLRRSSSAWDAAKSTSSVGFGDAQVRAAWGRLQAADLGLCRRMRQSWERVRQGGQKRTSFRDDLREICRAAIGQTVPHHLPLVIVDEIHNWKNHPTSWQRFLHMLGLRIDRLLGLSATPFQLGPHELIQVLNLRSCMLLQPEREAFLTKCVNALGTDLQAAQVAGESLRSFWTEVDMRDVYELERAWVSSAGIDNSLPPRLQNALSALLKVREAHNRLGKSLRPFMLRHRRDSSHRAWWVGREADPGWRGPSGRRNALRSQPGLDVGGDAELVHYLMMRAVQEQKAGRGLTSLGADLGGSYAFFREAELRRMLPGRNEDARRYLRLVGRAVTGNDHEHPKVAVTAERAFEAWRRGEKTLIFCFNVATVGSVQAAVNSCVDAYTTTVLTAALDCSEEQLEARLKNLQKRLYNYRQSAFLLFQDHPFAGPNGRVPRRLSIRERDIRGIAERLARGGPPRDGSRFDRRRVLAATEQVLVSRWMGSAKGVEWLNSVLTPLQLAETTSASIQLVSAHDWYLRRRELIEGILREGEVEALPEDEDVDFSGQQPRSEQIAAWRHVLESRAGQSTLRPYLYLAGSPIDTPSLLTRYHSGALAKLPARLRALAARMLRRMVRSPGFLARFILSDPGADTRVETSLVHNRYDSVPPSGESARTRFDAYLETLHKAVGLDEQVEAYQQASRNREIVARVTGSVPSNERDRLFMGFNSPLVPEVLIVTTVGQEGIDLHRECRHVIHHDLPWNPATLEQRTGRVDRIGSKTERLRHNESGDSCLDIAVPYIAGTYDEHRFRVVHGRAHIFEVTMGGKYTVDGHRSPSESASDDPGEAGVAWVPIPETIATDLRVHLEAESVDESKAFRRAGAS